MSQKKLFVAIALVFGAIFFIVKNAEENRLIEALESDKQALEQKMKDSTIIEQSLDLTFTEKQQIQVNQLWQEFEAFQYSGVMNWFEHKDFIEAETTDSLKAIIKNDGGLGLLSNYAGTIPLHHTQIQIKIGQERLDSIHLEQNQHIQTQSKILQVQESLLFEKATAANLIKQIALNNNKEIEVKLIGKDAFRSFKLSQKQKRAFKDTWTLHQLITI